MRFDLQFPRRLAVFMGLIVLLLSMAHLLLAAVTALTGHDCLGGLVAMFDLDEEWNIPSLYQAVSMLAVSAMLAAIGVRNLRMGEGMKTRWLFLSGLFAFLSLDELFGLHEMLTSVVRNQTHVDGVLHYAWVLPYALASLLIGLMYIGFLMRLPRRVAIGIVVAGIIYMAGAVGCEMAAGWMVSHHGSTFAYMIEVWVEETLEMSGIWLFAVTLSRVWVGSTAPQAAGIVQGQRSIGD